ncbi:MAG: 2Fe-2S iron-sulfur cluster-binding protein [Bacteroidia bacterium]|jgi:ring-1,2-phenylacetyl-CoA epoxidase subunit PaaE
MARFHPLKVSEIRPETTEAVSIKFEVPATLQPEFLYKQGQYLTLKMLINGQEIRRSYSICTAPHEKEWRVAVKIVEGGLVSGYLNRSLKIGDTIDVMTPMGSFNTPLSGAHEKNYVLWAGGSGITPMMSILKSVLYIEKKSHVRLIYANRNAESSIFKTELERLQSQYPAFEIEWIYDTVQGPLNASTCNTLIQHVPHTHTEHFICGPGPLMETVKTALLNSGINQKHIHIEYFNTVIQDTALQDSTNKTFAGTCQVKVIQYGIETEFELPASSISVLDAAIEAGVDAPYSCKGAVCCTCRGKIISGSADMKANFALTDDEVKSGYVLTCQAYPTSEHLVIDYDA